MEKKLSPLIRRRTWELLIKIGTIIRKIWQHRENYGWDGNNQNLNGRKKFWIYQKNVISRVWICTKIITIIINNKRLRAKN